MNSKSLITLSVSLALTALISACGQNDNAQAGSDASQAAQTAPTDTKLAATGVSPTALSAAPVLNESGSGAKCNLETVGGRNWEAEAPELDKANAIPVVGWYVNTNAGSVGSAPRLILTNEAGDKHWAFELTTRTGRDDVASSLANPALTNAGFEVDMNLSDFAPGYYNAALIDGDDVATACSVGRSFAVK